jgi:hypothetical protein
MGGLEGTRNEAIAKRVLDDPDFQTALMDVYATRVYGRARHPGLESGSGRG